MFGDAGKTSMASGWTCVTYTIRIPDACVGPFNGGPEVCNPQYETKTKCWGGGGGSGDDGTPPWGESPGEPTWDPPRRGGSPSGDPDACGTDMVIPPADAGELCEPPATKEEVENLIREECGTRDHQELTMIFSSVAL